MATSAGEKPAGIGDKVGDTANGIFNWIFGLPDRPDTETGRKVARIVFNLILIMVGVGMCSVAVAMSPLSNLPVTSCMILAVGLGIGSVGLAWMIQDVAPKQYHRTIGKVMNVLMPFLVAAGAACFMYSSLHAGFLTHIAMNGSCFVGILVAPLTFLALKRMGDMLRRNDDYHFIKLQDKQNQMNDDAAKRAAHAARKAEQKARQQKKEDSDRDVEMQTHKDYSPIVMDIDE